MDSKDVSCEACNVFLDEVRISPERYLQTSTFSELSTCASKNCGIGNCQVRVMPGVYFCSQHKSIHNIISDANKVILVLGMTVDTIPNDAIRGFIERDPNGDHLFRVLNIDAKDVVIVCYDMLNGPTPSIRRQAAGHTLLGLQGRFDQLIQKYPGLVGQCDLILNDYSTSKFFPDDFPNTIARLLTPVTGQALLRGLSRHIPYVDYEPRDKEICPSQKIYNVTLLNGKVIPIHVPHNVRLAQVLYQVQLQSRTRVSSDAIVVFAGRRLLATDSLRHVPTGSTLHIVVTLGQHFVDAYEKQFKVHQQSDYYHYPIIHEVEPKPTGVWLLYP
jgi:hypothetical protein